MRLPAMRLPCILGATLLILAALGGGASAANMCRAGKLSCATTMPVDGYCECTAHGTTETGTVVAKSGPRHPANATAAGCSAHPNSPGCS